MTFFYFLLVALIVFLISVTIILLLIGPVLLLHPRRRRAEFYRRLGLPTTPAEAKIPGENITITVDDGLQLQCWLVKTNGPARGTILYMHGVGDCKIDGLRLAKVLHTHGYNVFLYDSRRHGDSGGAFCTYGFYEKRDVSAIIDYLNKRSDLTVGRVGLFGTSMGAAVALQAAAVDHRIAAIVAENSFATLRTIFDDYQKRMIKVPFHYLRNMVIRRSEIMANFKAREVAPLRDVVNIHVPTLFIYGKEDHLINHRYSLRLFAYANEPKEIYAIENARHNDTWSVAGPDYERKILDFFDRNIS